MRSVMADVRKSPPGVNLAPPLKTWLLSGGATYDSATDTVHMPLSGGVTLPLTLAAKVDGRPWVVGFEQLGDAGTSGRVLVNTHYSDREKSPHTVPGGWTSNGIFLDGSSHIYTGEWESASYSAQGVMWDEDLTYMRFVATTLPSYIDGPVTLRNPTITTTGP